MAKRTGLTDFDGVKFGVIPGVSLPIRLHLRSDLHLARKFWHLVMGLAIAFIYLSGMSRTTAVVILGTVLGWDLVMETVRLHVPAFNEKILRIWGPFMRRCEFNRISGIPYYLAAAMLAIGIFPKPIAILSIVYLAVGDPIASMFGILYGDRARRFANGKSLIGTAAGIIACMIATMAFSQALGIPQSMVWTMTLVGGLAGGLAEMLPLEVDDNFSIPVVSGFALWLAMILLGTV